MTSDGHANNCSVAVDLGPELNSGCSWQLKMAKVPVSLVVCQRLGSKKPTFPLVARRVAAQTAEKSDWAWCKRLHEEKKGEKLR